MRFLIFTLTLLTAGLCQIGGKDQYQFDRYFTELRFSNRRATCTIQSSTDQQGGIPDYADEDCTIYLYVNNERVAYEYSKTLTYKYKQLLRVTLRCDATCKNIRFGDTVVSSSELTINTYEFIGLCAGAGVLVILLVIALFCGARHCKRTYYTKLEDQEEAADAPPRRQARSPEPTAPSLPPRVEIEMETPPAKHFSDSSESDSDNEDVDTQRRALYNLNYNYPEKASDI